MSGQREAHFLIQDTRKARQLRERRVAERIQALFSVHLSLAAARAQGEWVTLRGSDENTEKAKVSEPGGWLSAPSYVHLGGRSERACGRSMNVLRCNSAAVHVV